MPWLATLLRDRRGEILERWLIAVRGQPFHRGRPERAVSDEIPRLYDAVVGLIEREEAGAPDVGLVLDDPAIVTAARGHAHARAEQGLQPADVVAEFRLLRHDVRWLLRSHVPEDLPMRSAARSELLVVDALDSAIAVGLAAFTEQVEAVREEFLVTTVHEVRHPLTAIDGNAQFIERLLARPWMARERLATAARAIREETGRMATLLAALSDASLAAMGRLLPQTAEVDMVGLLEELAQALDPETAGRVRFDVEPGMDSRGRWDGLRIRQVVTNLLDNAAKYAPGVTPISVRVVGGADAIQLSVHDEGIGLDADDLPRLFQRYVRARTAQEHGIPGLGVGLYLCRAIVEAHGGRIWAESPGRDRGTTVLVRLPRRVLSDA